MRASFGPGWSERSSNKKQPASKEFFLDPETEKELSHQEQRAASYARLEKALELLKAQERHAAVFFRGKE